MMFLLVAALVAANIITWTEIVSSDGYFDRHPWRGVALIAACFLAGAWVEAL